MASPLNRPLVCPIVVGRVPYLAALDAQIEAARSAEGQVLFVTGEAGIGKSRLVAEARARAAARRMLVLAGRCFEPDHTFPYAPLLDLLRTYLAAQPADTAVREFATSAPAASLSVETQ